MKLTKFDTWNGLYLSDNEMYSLGMDYMWRPSGVMYCVRCRVRMKPTHKYVGQANDFGSEALLPVYARTGYQCPRCRARIAISMSEREKS